MAALVLLILGLLASAGALELQLAEHAEAPGLSSQTYHLVEKDAEGNARVVGVVQHVTAGGGPLGRRGGPFFPPLLVGGEPLGPDPMMGPEPLLDPMLGPMGPPGPLARLFMRGPLADLVGQARHVRCGMMRRLGAPGAGDFDLLNQQLGPALVQRLAEPQALPEEEAEADLGEEGGLQLLFGGKQAPGPGGRELPPFRLRAMPWQEPAVWEPRRMHHPVARLPGPGMLLGEPGEHPPCEGCGRGMPMMGGMMGHRQEARWTSLEDTTMPAVDPGTIDWRLWDDDGTLNTGLVVFFVLSAACVGVWAAGVASYLSYARAVRRLPRCCPAARQFVVGRKDSDLLAPLMPEGPLKKHTGVEFAVEHTPQDFKLGYEPLK